MIPIALRQVTSCIRNARFLCTNASHAQITGKIEQVINRRRLFETQDYIDFPVDDRRAMVLKESVDKHPWVMASYLGNGYMRVFPVGGQYPSLVDDDEENIAVSRQGESHELP